MACSVCRDHASIDALMVRFFRMDVDSGFSSELALVSPSFAARSAISFPAIRE